MDVKNRDLHNIDNLVLLILIWYRIELICLVRRVFLNDYAYALKPDGPELQTISLCMLHLLFILLDNMGYVYMFRKQ